MLPVSPFGNTKLAKGSTTKVTRLEPLNPDPDYTAKINNSQRVRKTPKGRIAMYRAATRRGII